MKFKMEGEEDGVYELTEQGRAHADRLDPDGKRAAFREARQHYAAGQRAKGDAMVVLLCCRAVELGDKELLAQARELGRLGDRLVPQ